jgi:NAD(P)H-flavin reductase
MLLLATGTGLAPLIGIARDALSRGHRGRIVIVHGVRYAKDAYGTGALRELVDAHSNVESLVCLSQEAPPDGFIAGRAVDVAFDRFEDLEGWRVYLCGSPAVVAAAKRAAYLAGARMEHICSDPFEASTGSGNRT